MEAKDVLARMKLVSDNLKASIRDGREQRKALDIEIATKVEDQELVDEAIREIEASITNKENDAKKEVDSNASP